MAGPDLYHNGAVFLEDVFEDDPRMAPAVNKLLVTGFYMANLGYAGLILKSDAAPTAVAAVEVLGRKLGVLLLSLAGPALPEHVRLLPPAPPGDRRGAAPADRPQVNVPPQATAGGWVLPTQ